MKKTIISGAIILVIVIPFLLAAEGEINAKLEYGPLMNEINGYSLDFQNETIKIGQIETSKLIFSKEQGMDGFYFENADGELSPIPRNYRFITPKINGIRYQLERGDSLLAEGLNEDQMSDLGIQEDTGFFALFSNKVEVMETNDEKINILLLTDDNANAIINEDGEPTILALPLDVQFQQGTIDGETDLVGNAGAEAEVQDGKDVGCFDNDETEDEQKYKASYVNVVFEENEDLKMITNPDFCARQTDGNGEEVSRLYEAKCDENGNAYYEEITCDCRNGACVSGDVIERFCQDTDPLTLDTQEAESRLEPDFDKADSNEDIVNAFTRTFGSKGHTVGYYANQEGSICVECIEDVDCEAGEVCDNNVCTEEQEVIECENNDPCDTWQACVDGECGFCTEDDQCDQNNNEVCVSDDICLEVCRHDEERCGDHESCVDDVEEQEAFCKLNNGVACSVGAQCISGHCTNGICTENQPILCSDSEANSEDADGDGKSFGLWEDYCSTDEILVEYYCSNEENSVFRTVICPNGCSNGQCVEKPYCFETDGGNTVQFKGTTKALTTNDEYLENTDECLDSNTVREYFCNSTNTESAMSSSDTACEDSEYCSNGKCIAEEPCETDEDCDDGFVCNADTNLCEEEEEELLQFSSCIEGRPYHIMTWQSESEESESKVNEEILICPENHYCAIHETLGAMCVGEPMETKIDIKFAFQRRLIWGQWLNEFIGDEDDSDGRLWETEIHATASLLNESDAELNNQLEMAESQLVDGTALEEDILEEDIHAGQGQFNEPPEEESPTELDAERGSSCSTDADCDDGEQCLNGYCVSTICNGALDCGGFICDDGICDTCTSDEDCKTGNCNYPDMLGDNEEYVEGMCIPAEEEGDGTASLNNNLDGSAAEGSQDLQDNEIQDQQPPIALDNIIP